MEILKVNEFQGHIGSIYTLSASSEDHIVYSVGADKRIIAWDLYEPDKSSLLVNLNIKAFAIKYIEEFDLLTVGNINGGIHIIDLIKKQEIKLLQHHTGPVFAIEFVVSKNELVVGSEDGSFSVWSVPDFKLLYTRKVSEKKVRSIAINEKSNQCFITTSDLNIIETYLTDYSEKQSYKLEEKDQFITSSIINDDDLIIGSRGYLSIYNNGKLIKKIAAHKFAIYSIVLSPNGKYMATCSLDKTIRIWDAKSYALIKQIDRANDSSHSNSVNKLLWNTYNNYLISASDDRLVMAWKILDS